MPTRTLASVTLVGLITGFAPGQDLTHKAAPQSRPVVIMGAAIHPVSGPAIERGVIWFEKGLIAGVATAEEFRANGPDEAWRRSARVVDGTGLSVYPGMISAYSHLGMTEIQAVAATNDTDETGAISPEVRATIAVNPDSTLVPVTRTNGILTAAVFPTGGMIPGQAGLIRLDGWTIEDMAIEPSLGVVLRWPTVRPVSAWWMDRSEEDQLREMREEMDRLRRTFDTARAYDTQRDADESTPIDLRWEAMRPLFAGTPTGVGAVDEGAPESPQQPLFILAQDSDQITTAVKFCEEWGLRCVIVGGREAASSADLLARRRVPVILQGVHNMPRRDDSPYDEAYTVPARLRDAGVSFCIVNNDDTAHERNLPYSAATASAYGLTREEALASVTLWPARVLGVDDRLGSLEVGKSATLLVVSGDPLDVIGDVRMAFIDGREIDLSNKQTKLTEKYVDRYEQLGQMPPSRIGEEPGAAPPASPPRATRPPNPGRPRPAPKPE
ncbi:MAG TPA: amidohydrolase family protein [Phycisphaerales bacterium]|nr:amidohydrolase family protein [Phycisphaerales bacterium]